MTNPGHTAEIEELLAVHALCALEGDDLRLLEEHLAAGCPECRTQLAELERSLEALLESVEPVVPSEMTRARLLAQLPAATNAAMPAPPAPPRAMSRRGTAWGWLAAAALLLVCGGGWLATRRDVADLRAERDDLSRRVSGMGQELASARATNERLAQAMAIISSPGMRPIALAALEGAPGARGHTFVDPRTSRAVFVAANLPQLAADKTYELWFIADGKPVAAGTFGVDPSGRSGTVEVGGVAPLDHIQAWAVTVEPRGGVPQPTGTMVLKGVA